jgi:hypothetical protein
MAAVACSKHRSSVTMFVFYNGNHNHNAPVRRLTLELYVALMCGVFNAELNNLEAVVTDSEFLPSACC